jgi:hypothetical protein
MDKQILPERANPAEQIALRTIADSRGGLTIKAIQEQNGGRSGILQAVLRSALDQLVAEEILECEKPSRGPAIYFLPYQKPSPCLKSIPAAKARPIRVPQCNWLAALGVQA